MDRNAKDTLVPIGIIGPEMIGAYRELESNPVEKVLVLPRERGQARG
jgi:hypothetical protein